MVRFMKNGNHMPRLENGFVYLWALFSVVLAGVAMAGAAQLWQTKSLREKEAELMFIGEEFRKAIMSYHNSGNKQYPSSLEDLLKDERSPNIKRHLRKIYVDPITNTAEWGFVDESQANAAPATSGANAATGTNQTSGTAQSGTNPTGAGSASGTNPTSAANPATNAGLTPASGQSAQTGNQATTNPAATPGNKPASSNNSGISSSIGKRIAGVYSLSEKKPIKKDRFPEHFAKFSEALTYQDWRFIYKPGDSKTPSSSATPGAASKNSTSNPFAAQSSSGTAAKTNSPFAPQSSSAADDD
jgi:type II secretory pathway pseudopilin PulG